MTRKVDIINTALSRLGISGITREPTPEDMAEALHQLEYLMRSRLNRNVQLNYNFEDTPDPQSETNVDDRFNDWMATELAVRLIPYYGSSINENRIAQLKADARELYAGVSAYRAAQRTNEVQYPVRQPRGNGNTLRHDQYDRFYSQIAEIVRDIVSDEDSDNGGGDRVCVITGAEASSFNFDPGLTASENIASLSYEASRIYMHSGAFLNVYSTTGTLISTQRLDLAGLVGGVIGMCATPTGIIALVNNSGTITLQRLALASPHAPGTIISDITSDGMPTNMASLAVSPSGEIYIADGGSVRVYSSSGSLQSTIDISGQTTGAKGIVFVGNDFWVVGGTTVYRYSSNVFASNSFSTTQNETFGIAWDGENFWEGGATTDRIFRRASVETCTGGGGGGSGDCDCSVGDISGLQAALDDKADNSDITNVQNQISNLQNQGILTSVSDVESASESIISDFTEVAEHTVSSPPNSVFWLDYDELQDRLYVSDGAAIRRYTLDGVFDNVTVTTDLTNGVAAFFVTGAELQIFNNLGDHQSRDKISGVISTPTRNNPEFSPIAGVRPPTDTGIASATLATRSGVRGVVRGLENVAIDTYPFTTLPANVDYRGITWHDGFFWIVDNAKVLRQYTVDFEPTGLSHTFTGADVVPAGIAFASDTRFFEVSPTTILREWSVEFDTVATLTAPNIRYLIEVGGTGLLPDDTAFTVDSFISDNQIAVSSTGTIPTGTIEGETIREGTLGVSQLTRVRRRPVLFAGRG